MWRIQSGECKVLHRVLYGALIEAIGYSTLPQAARQRIEFILTALLRQEETLLGLIAQHNALLAADQGRLSIEAVTSLDQLALLTDDDYKWAADLAVREIGETYCAYADLDAVRALVLGAVPGA